MTTTTTVPDLRRFRPTGHPVADPANVLTGPGYRITVLTDGLVRLEYSASGEFEDRVSQAVVDRAREVLRNLESGEFEREGEPRLARSRPLPLERMCGTYPEAPLDVPLHRAAAAFWKSRGYL